MLSTCEYLRVSAYISNPFDSKTQILSKSEIENLPTYVVIPSGSY